MAWFPLSRVVSFYDATLDTGRIADTAQNGLQVSGSKEIEKIGFAVDASMSTFRAAAEQGCNLVVVHHGLFWSRPVRMVGTMYQRIRFLIDNNIALYASHLPLDAHPVYGNNARLAKLLGLRQLKPFGDYNGTPIGYVGSLQGVQKQQKMEKQQKTEQAGKRTAIRELAAVINRKINTRCRVYDFGLSHAERVAVVTGRPGSAIIEQAAEQEIDCLIVGEIVHENFHLLKDCGLTLIEAGHYRSETLGVRALMGLTQKRFKGLETVFIDNPTGI